ncbi:MAG: thioredoxin family protein [Pseudomonadota bacterium]
MMHTAVTITGVDVMRYAALVAFAALVFGFAHAELADRPEAEPDPIVKIINFTADWCPNCRIVDPRIDEVLERQVEGEFELVELDMTRTWRASDEEKMAVFADVIRTADAHKAGYLWDWYGGRTGITVLIAADTGEPISCITAALDTDQIDFRFAEARILALRAPPGARKPDGPACPPPMNG